MEKLPDALYNPEFRLQSVQFFKENELTHVEAAVIFDRNKKLFKGELPGYAMNERMTKDLVIQSLFR